MSDIIRIIISSTMINKFSACSETQQLLLLQRVINAAAAPGRRSCSCCFRPSSNGCYDEIITNTAARAAGVPLRSCSPAAASQRVNWMLALTNQRKQLSMRRWSCNQTTTICLIYSAEFLLWYFFDENYFVKGLIFVIVIVTLTKSPEFSSPSSSFWRKVPEFSSSSRWRKVLNFR